MTPREEELLKKLAERDAEIALLRQKIDLLIKRIFGSKSEKLSPAQLELLFGPENPGKADASSEKEEAKFAQLTLVRETGERKMPRPPRQPRIPDHLPTVIEIIEPAEIKEAPEQWRYIGDEVSEQLDYEPARFLKRQLIRRKYVHRKASESAFAIAPLPPVLQERCIATPGLLAQIIVAKYAHHLPLYRQESIFRSQHGVEIPRQTLARWLGMAADWLKPVYHEIQRSLFSQGYLQIDETPIKYLSPGNGAAKQGYLWVCKQPQGSVAFQWHTSRSADCLKAFIPSDFRGILQCDGYTAYDCFARRHEKPILLAGCYAHVRREFFEAKEQSPQVAGWILRQIRNLYLVERRLRKERAGPRLRQAIRASESRMIHERLGRALIRLKSSGRYLPKSQMGKAINYALGQWESLNVFLEHGQVCIDNNPVENAIRPTAVGKRNWLFVGDATTGERSAILYTLIENCRLRGIDPYAYLCETLTRLPHLTNRQIGNVTPAAYVKTINSQPLKIAS